MTPLKLHRYKAGKKQSSRLAEIYNPKHINISAIKILILGRPGQNDTWSNMIQYHFSIDDVVYDVSYSNFMRIFIF